MSRPFRLGVVLSKATEAPPKEFVELGKLAEDKGFDAMLVNEGRGDALACAEAIALASGVQKPRLVPRWIILCVLWVVPKV